MADSLFQQAFEEVRRSVEAHGDLPESFDRWRVFERLRSPDRVIRFTVRWMDDRSGVQYTPAWRVQYCNALGPYKGGLRFADHVDEDTLLFLGFEQSLKNALTGLPLGGGKGGACFKTSDHSPEEVLRFCHAFMDEYIRYGGADTDVAAGDIGTGPREIGWLYGRFAKLTGEHAAMLTGKPVALGGIHGRVEATGYGTAHFARLMCRQHEQVLGEFEGKRIAISGAGNVALHAAERAIDEDAVVLTLSNSKGTAHFPDDGLRAEQLAQIKQRVEDGDRLEQIVQDMDGAEFDNGEGAVPWTADRRIDIAMPCATQNELNGDHAEAMARNGIKALVEGANMPCTSDATSKLMEAGVLIAPGKAANAGGVAVSAFEMTQNATREPWSRQDVLAHLDEVMQGIHDRCVAKGERDGCVDYIAGANLAGFERVGEAIVAAGPN